MSEETMEDMDVDATMAENMKEGEEKKAWESFLQKKGV